MKPIYEIRRANLRALMEQEGGPTRLSMKLGLANGSYLAQVAGPKPSRLPSEKGARKIEAKLKLPAGWLDEDRSGLHSPELDEAALGQSVAAVSAAIEAAKLKIELPVYSLLVSLTYKYAKETGKQDEVVAQQLVRLLQLTN